MIVVDANVLIAHLNAEDALHATASRVLTQLPEQPLGVSPITLAEVLVGPVRAGQVPLARAALDRLGVTAVQLPADAAVRLAELRARTRLRMPDCCVLLTASQTGAGVATFDAALITAAEAEGITVYAGAP